ncbi:MULTISPECIES: hypothetical protein [Pseudoalteromonas]|jgi:hypothetical protein|nr:MULTISPECIES: hypothetical protein [Pseudoalteromonas]EWH04069.1 hypothetical protein AT00_21235 [Pseudoalteromonas lipolytica SCSIO 04301]MBE0352488.1 hypothetical protein [Pseudoalteromonas lipolytica LMEB 39]MCC9662282.1 hypothetical protein [Pseudoalteromonas sp. MB41]QLJ08349.1 hypothetical protein GZH31_00255 [Pseudoalteromonas sp. JSTW]QMW14596.1 hypothetical protein H3302_00255 [Pseudoalteromonas sp. MT33b]|tara:strand:- start:1012 stop:1479 length:468 start_codon:yes stop_codon:yes gene_type:complete
MRFSLLAVLFPALLTACSDAATTKQTELQATTSKLENAPQAVEISKSAPEKTTITAAHQQLKQLIQDPSCDNSSQCKVLPVGSRACGGPSSYVVYSTKTANSSEVEKIAQKITSLESQYNAANDVMSICQHLTAPGTQCSANTCVKIDGSAASVY